jgi:hypothetical protein
VEAFSLHGSAIYGFEGNNSGGAKTLQYRAIRGQRYFYPISVLDGFMPEFFEAQRVPGLKVAI